MVVAFALGIGVSAIVGNPLSQEKSPLQASVRGMENDGKLHPAVRTLTMDDDLSGFSARVSANRKAH